jgi:hypothetical protein
MLDYTPETYERVRQALLHVATILGDWMEQVTVIGGIVPSLLVPPNALPEGVEAHPGTADLDLGLQLSVLTDEGYATIAELLLSRKGACRPRLQLAHCQTHRPPGSPNSAMNASANEPRQLR